VVPEEDSKWNWKIVSLSALFVQSVFLAQVDSGAIYGNKWKLLQALAQSGGPQAGLAHINLPGNGKKPRECINS